jgi:hypothetical protein
VEINIHTVQGIAGASFALAVWVAVTMLGFTEDQACWLLFDNVLEG